MIDARVPTGLWARDDGASLRDGDAQVCVEGDPSAFWRGIPANAQSAGLMAVLSVRPFGLPFQVGWRTDRLVPVEFYSEDVITLNGQFAMGFGRSAVYFVVRPRDGRTQLEITFVNYALVSDLHYASLPRY
jgi:hypothetical protein